MTEQDGYVAIDGLRVFTRRAGAGRPAMLLIHGYAASLFTWHNVIEPFARLGEVIAFDQAGFGHTSRPQPEEWNGRNPYSADAQVDLAMALLDHFGIERAILVGHSAGGTIAALTALRHPDRVDSLLLVAPAIYSEAPPPRWAVHLLRRLPAQAAGPLLVRSIARLANHFLNLAWHDPSRIPDATRESYLQFLRVANWDYAFWQMSIADRAPRLARSVPELRMPTLVVTGDHDRVVAVRESRRLARELPDARLVVIPECGHIPQEERPDAFLATVMPFLEERAAAWAGRQDDQPSGDHAAGG
jgi:pimeloyl-ACP methyl ester carboxylesterase